MEKLEIVIYIIPCLLQIFVFYLDWKRINLISSLIGLFSFICLTTGLLCVVGAIGVADDEYHTAFLKFARIFLTVGSIGWMLTSVSWITHKIRIEKP